MQDRYTIMPHIDQVPFMPTGPERRVMVRSEAHLDGCAQCAMSASGSGEVEDLCPAGQTLDAELDAALRLTAETARWN